MQEELPEEEKLVQKKRDKELDDVMELKKESESNKVEERVVNVTLETQKSLFPPWTIKRIQKEAIDEPSNNWLEPSVSFELENTPDSQLDYPITPRAFLFRCFENIERALLSDSDVNHSLFSFYITYGLPQFRSWSLKKLVAVKVYAPIATDNFINIRFKGFKGANKSETDFTIADFPCTNPYD